MLYFPFYFFIFKWTFGQQLSEMILDGFGKQFSQKIGKINYKCSTYCCKGCDSFNCVMELFEGIENSQESCIDSDFLIIDADVLLEMLNNRKGNPRLEIDVNVIFIARSVSGDRIFGEIYCSISYFSNPEQDTFWYKILTDESRGKKYQRFTNICY